MRRQTWSDEVDYRHQRRDLHHLAGLPRVRVPWVRAGPRRQRLRLASAVLPGRPLPASVASGLRAGGPFLAALPVGRGLGGAAPLGFGLRRTMGGRLPASAASGLPPGGLFLVAFPGGRSRSKSAAVAFPLSPGPGRSITGITAVTRTTRRACHGSFALGQARAARRQRPRHGRAAGRASPAAGRGGPAAQGVLAAGCCSRASEAGGGASETTRQQHCQQCGCLRRHSRTVGGPTDLSWPRKPIGLKRHC